MNASIEAFAKIGLLFYSLGVKSHTSLGLLWSLIDLGNFLCDILIALNLMVLIIIVIISTVPKEKNIIFSVVYQSS